MRINGALLSLYFQPASGRLLDSPVRLWNGRHKCPVAVEAPRGAGII